MARRSRCRRKIFSDRPPGGRDVRSSSVIIGALPDGYLPGARRAANLAHRHLAESEHKALLPFRRQRLPNRAEASFGHRAIQASAPRRVTPESQAAGDRRVVSSYKRFLVWGIEPSFRDTKDLRFGMGLGATRIGEPMRRDRLLLINAFAMVLLTMLGAAGESLGMDRLLKSNTSKRRTHSLFRQGCMLYELIPTMPAADGPLRRNRSAVQIVQRHVCRHLK